MDRRVFLKRAAATATAAIPFTAFVSRAEALPGRRRGEDATYGPLAPVRDETTGLPLLWLPAGFSYVSFGWRGDLMSNGTPTPGAHDGMAAFRAGGRRVGHHRGNDDEGGNDNPGAGDHRGRGHLALLVRNHELGAGTPFSGALYDAGAAGGTTNLVFDTRRGELVEAYDSLSGTIRNCAGGPTPWQSWLTCEETTLFTTVPHGYIFDVPANDLGDPTPIRDMGRFSHEAVTVDPVTGYVYETEDAGFQLRFLQVCPAQTEPARDGRPSRHAEGRRRAPDVVLNGERNGIVGDFRGAEWAGACYSPDGQWLFANVYSPGITVAITGPWRNGAL